MNAAFFLSSLDRCLPELTEVVIDAATVAQSVEIHESLLKIRLKQKCFVALATLSPRSVVQGLKSESDLPVDGNDNTLHYLPTSDGMILADESAETYSPALVSTERTGREAAPAENGAKSLDPHNPYPRGRWTR